MKGSKLISVLLTLEKEEWYKVDKYILSQPGDSSNNYILFSLLRTKNLTQFDALALNKLKSLHFNTTSDKAFFLTLKNIESWTF